jgi:hypothetical protein
MASTTIFAKDFTPYTPDLDPRRWAKSGVISGRNFLADVDGPRSAFGNVFVDYYYWPKHVRRKFTEMRINEEIFYGTPGGVFRSNPHSRLPEPILSIDSDEALWPWSVAFVGNNYYFAQHNIGLWQYDSIRNKIFKIDTPVGENVIGVCESYSRLIILNDTLFAWSAIDDGTDFTPSLVTNAGAQATSLLGGKPYRVDPIDEGFLVATSSGIIKAEHTTADYIFAPTVLSRDVKIFSPNAAIKIPDIGVIYVDASGFHATNGAVPEPWEPDMGTYIRDNILNRASRRKSGLIGMYFSQASRMVFVYFSANEEEALFRRSFVYYIPSGKWSPFNYTHYGVFETQKLGDLAITSISFMGDDGYIRQMGNYNYAELERGGEEDQHVLSDHVLRPFEEPDMLKNFAEDGTLVDLGRTELNYLDFDPSTIEEEDRVKLFTRDADGAILPYSLPQDGVNSFIEIGLFRFLEQTETDMASAINLLGVHLSRGIIPYSTTDLETETGTEDLQAEDGSGDEDLGSAVGNLADFNLHLLDTDDGHSEPVQGWEHLMRAQQNGAAFFYAPCGFSSLFHKLKLTAYAVGESYALKAIELTGAITGRLYG